MKVIRIALRIPRLNREHTLWSKLVKETNKYYEWYKLSKRWIVLEEFEVKT